jgi:hypothetical protein
VGAWREAPTLSIMNSREYLNNLIIYFTCGKQASKQKSFNYQTDLHYNFPTWPPSRIGKRNGIETTEAGNSEFDEINEIFSAHNIVCTKDQYCHPNFGKWTIGQIDNSILYQTIGPLNTYFLDKLPEFQVRNVTEVSLINMFHSEVILNTPDTLSFMDSDLYLTPDRCYEIGFSYITTTGYIQRTMVLSQRQLEQKIGIKFSPFPSGHLEFYIQHYMIYPFFVNQNLIIDLEHAPSK